MHERLSQETHTESQDIALCLLAFKNTLKCIDEKKQDNFSSSKNTYFILVVTIEKLLCCKLMLRI